VPDEFPEGGKGKIRPTFNVLYGTLSKQLCSLTVRHPNLWLIAGLRRLMGGTREWKLF
jgi:hypothetical protein